MPRKKAEKPAKPRKQFAFFITTIPVIRPCAKCGRWLAAGITDGMHVEVDFVQLDPGQAFVARLAGLHLYAITRTGIVHLDEYRLNDSKFAGRQPEHRCEITWPSLVVGAGPGATPVKTDTPPY